MTVVIDVGAARHGGEYSVERLVERFKPHTLYAFDPLIAGQDVEPKIGDTRCIYIAAAAWTYDGWIGFKREGSRSRVMAKSTQVPAVDLAAFIRTIADEMIVLKIDAEGAEYQLLPHLRTTGADELLMLALVEWHPQYDPDGSRRAYAEAAFHPRIEEWHF